MSETSAAQPTGQSPPRRVLLLAHTGRDEAREVARAFCKALTGHGIVVRLLADEARDLGLDPEQLDPAIEIARDETRRRRGLRARAGHRRRRHDPARRGADPRERHAGARGEPRSRRLPRRGGVRRRRVDDRRDRAPALHRRGPAHPRRHRLPRRRARHEHLRAQRGQRREGRPRADARGRRRDRRPTAVPVGLRRRRVRHADRLHRLQLQRRRPGRLARASRRC